MSIQLNANIKIAAPAPIDKRYLSERTLGGSPLPYSANTEVYSTIPSSERYTGLTVNINNNEYWFRNNTTTLILKSITGSTTADAVTGATNLGFFSGKTGVQILPIDNLSDNTYDGNYQSVYNWYYRGSDAEIHTGTPNDGIRKRGYVRPPTFANPYYKSWIWNEYTADTFGYRGWILINGNIASQIGTVQPAVPYFNGGSSFPYTATTWISGAPVIPTQGWVAISTIQGSLNTGTTITVGGPPYANEVNHVLNFRTVISDTPSSIGVTYDESFIHISGMTYAYTGQNVGSGTGNIFKQKTGTTLQFRTIEGTGDTVVYQVGDRVLISAYGSVSGTTTATNIGTGIGVYKNKTGSTLQLRTILGSGDTTVSILSGNTIVVGSVGGGTYNLASPSTVALGGISSGTTLTGKTSFQLWEELLVPELFGTITPPSTGIILSACGLHEIGCSLSQTVVGGFDQGSILPQYASVCDKRSGLPISYKFTGCGMTPGFQLCPFFTASQVNPSYVVSAGTQSWGVCTCYDSGYTAMGSKGTVYSAALPTGCTSAASGSIIGAYPLYATTSNITTLTPQTLQNMSTATNVQINLCADSSPNKQKFEIPCAWLGAPTNKPLQGVLQYNTVSSNWEYPGGTAPSSLAIWTCGAASETVQGNTVGYCQYTYNSTDRSTTCIRLVF